MSRSYKFINFPDHKIISEKIYDYIVNSTKVLELKSPWNTLDADHLLDSIPELRDAFDMLGLTVEQVAIVYCGPNKHLSVHIDGDHTFARLLWPVKNCDGSRTRFFSLESLGGEDKIKAVKTSLGETAYTIDVKDGVRPIDDLELVSPAVIKPWVPHGVWTNPKYTEPRLTMTVKFDQSLEFMLD